MPKVSIGDADIFYESYGEGPPLLLVPGLGGIGSWWAKQIPEFARDFRVIVHDHRGAGQSTWSRMQYSVDQMTGDLLKLMDTLGIGAAHLVGHSTGGAIGQILAQDQPSRVRSLVISASWAGPDPYFRRLFEARKTVLQHLGVDAYLRQTALSLVPPKWISENDAALTQQHKEQAAAAAPVEVMQSRIDAIVRFDRRARLGEIRCPTLVIVAADDMITPLFYSEELVGKIPGAELVVLESGGHFAPVIAPGPYNAAVGAFLRGRR